jgi:hypothetical protein
MTGFRRDPFSVIIDSSFFKTDVAKNVFEQLIALAHEEEKKMIENGEGLFSDIVTSHFAMLGEAYRLASDVECNYRQMNAQVTAMVSSISEQE